MPRWNYVSAVVLTSLLSLDSIRSSLRFFLTTFKFTYVSQDHKDRMTFLTLSQTTNFRSSKLKEFADDNFKFDENGR